MISGKIYKLSSVQCDKYYIGSTKLSLEERLKSHESGYELWVLSDFRTSYLSSFEILKYGDYEIELVEDYPCNSIKELHDREFYYQTVDYLNIVNIALAGQFNTGYTFSTPDKYKCVCGSIMMNSYVSRWKHSATLKHFNKIRLNHMELLSKNPAYEVLEISKSTCVNLPDGSKVLFIV
jgi:hypothetical protein